IGEGGDVHVALTRVGHAADKQTGGARNILDRVKKRTIDFHFYRLLWFLQSCRQFHHHYFGWGGCFRAFFFHGNECLMKNVGDRQILVRLARRHLVEIGAALRHIERRFHSERLKRFTERNRRRLDLKFWQLKIDILWF